MLGALALIGSLLVAAPAHALGDTGTGGVFVPATGRVLDTKAGTGGFNTPMEAGKYRTVKVTGLPGVPDDGTVGAISLNTTVGQAPSPGTLFGRPDANTSRTTMSIYTGVSGEYDSNSAVVAVAADGTIQIMTETTARVVLDVQGYYTTNTNGTAAGGFVPVAGKRFVDTRSGLGAPKAAIAPGKSVDVQVTGANGVPVGASGAVVNLIAINSTSLDGNLSPYATGGTKPQNSLHYTPSTTTSIQAQVALSADGRMTIANSSTTINLVVDLQGYFTRAGQGGAVFTPAAGRAYDSRATGNTALGKNETRAIQVAGVAGVPVIGSGITAVVFTLIVAHGGSDGRATVWADGATKPDTTAINFTTDEIRTNTVTVPLGANGKVALNNVADPTNYVIDIQGWYASPNRPLITCQSPLTDGSWTSAPAEDDTLCQVSVPAVASDPAVTIVIDGVVQEEPVDENGATIRPSEADGRYIYDEWIDSGPGSHAVKATSSDGLSAEVRFGAGDWSTSALELSSRAETGDSRASILHVQSAEDVIPDGAKYAFAVMSADGDVVAMSGEFAGTDGDHGAEWKVPSQVLADEQTYTWNVQVAAPTQPGFGAGYSASNAPVVVRSSDALLPDSLPARDESAVEGTESTSSGSGSAMRATALQVCAYYISSDKPHYSGGDISVHGWWTNVNCKNSPKATVTVVLQRKTNGTWSKIGKGETLKNLASGGGRGKRATARYTCSGSTKWDWRPYVTVDVYTVKETVTGAYGQTVTQACKK
jgi:hypothetical protein